MIRVVDFLPPPTLHFLQIRAGEIVPPLVEPVDPAILVGEPGQLGNIVGKRGKLVGLLAKAGLQFDLLAQVVRDLRRADDAAGRIAHRRDCHRDRHGFAALRETFGRKFRNGLPRTDSCENPILFLGAIFRHDPADRLSHHFRGRPAEKRLCSGVPSLYGAVERLRDYRVRRACDDGSKTGCVYVGIRFVLGHAMRLLTPNSFSEPAVI